MELLGGVNQADLWKIRQLDYLCQQLKCSCDHSLTGNNGGQDGKNQTRIEHTRWNSVEERIRISARIIADERGLTGILQESVSFRYSRRMMIMLLLQITYGEK